MRSGLKISNVKIATILHFVVLLVAGLSTILRPSIESKLTLFRVLLPLLYIWLFLANYKKGIRMTTLILGFFVYAILASLFSRFHTINWPFMFYYITIFFFFYYYKEILSRIGVSKLYVFFKYLYKGMIILGYLQFFFGGVYFNTQNRLPATNIFFWNENEYAAVLTIFTPLFFLKEKTIFKYVWIVLTIYMIKHNDAKLALLSLIIFFGGYLILKFKLFKLRYIGFGVLLIFGVLSLFFLKEYTIKGRVTIGSFLSELITGIFTGNPLDHVGSFNSRSNAVILGIKEFFSSYFLGIGPGNSNLMIAEVIEPGTEKWAGKSMHNFSLQLVTEIGIFGIALLGGFFLRVRNVALKSTYPINLVWIYFISCIVSVTLLSGIWSNYFYLVILFYALDFFKYNAKTKI